MKTVVFGANGMLGRYVVEYFDKMAGEDEFIFEACRRDLDVSKATEAELISVLSQIQEAQGESPVVINCAGVIKPRVAEVGVEETIQVNSLFPRRLANACEKLSIKLVHVTTDCVFDGVAGNYNESDPHSVNDIYGKSKSLGEPENCMVVRTSIIGEEETASRSLLEWVKSQKDKTCSGYTNHFWNGVTCLQLAKVIYQIVTKGPEWKGGVRHVFTPESLMKSELVKLISDVYSLNITVEDAIAEKFCNRVLTSNQPEKFDVPSLREQIQEQMDFFKPKDEE